MPEPAETQCEREPLPLFRPEVLSKQERFFGEVLLIRPFSFWFLGWLVGGAAALAYGVLFFSTYTETAAVRGILLRGPTPGRASVAVPSLHAAIEPGMQVAIRCLHCANPIAEFPAIARGVSDVTAPAGKAGSRSARQIVELSYEASAASSFEQWPASGTAVELALPIGQRRLFDLFEPSSARGKPQQP
jgi:hypothetical protein